MLTLNKFTLLGFKGASIIMKKKLQFYFSALLACLILAACQSETIITTNDTTTNNAPLVLVATTTMLHDLSNVIGGEKIQASCLMGIGVDPHLYVPTAKDTTTLENANVILYHGLHLEGEMGDVLARMESLEKNIICIADALDPSKLLADEENPTMIDPHIWFDVELWMDAAEYLATELATIDPQYASYYESNLADYQEKLEELDQYIHNRVQELPEQQRILITAHDAFQYFGNRYGMTVSGVQGIATQTEATTAQVSLMADYIVQNEISAIFVESSISSKNMEALQEAVAAQGFTVKIGGELYSDSLGDGAHSSYLATYQGNIDTIVDALLS